MKVLLKGKYFTVKNGMFYGKQEIPELTIDPHDGSKALVKKNDDLIPISRDKIINKTSITTENRSVIIDGLSEITDDNIISVIKNLRKNILNIFKRDVVEYKNRDGKSIFAICETCTFGADQYARVYITYNGETTYRYKKIAKDVVIHKKAYCCELRNQDGKVYTLVTPCTSKEDFIDWLLKPSKKSK